MRTAGSPEVLAALRRLAVARLLDGWEPLEVAEFLGVHVSSVCRWRERFESEGWEGLAAGCVPGRPPKLTAEQAQRLVSWVQDQSPQDLGFPTGHWTARRVAALAQQRLGVCFNPRYLSDWLRRHGITPQIPDPVPWQRDEAAVARWIAYTWPAIKRGRNGRGPPSFSPMKQAC
jgi:transposase